MKRLFAALFALAVLLLGRAAAAQPIRLAFDVPLEESPNRLCFVAPIENRDSFSLKLLEDTSVATKDAVALYLRKVLEGPAPAGGSCEKAQCGPAIPSYPKFPKEQPHDLHVVCTENTTKPLSDKSRVLFVLLDFQTEQSPRISDPYLGGTVASAMVTKRKPNTFVTARVLGGDYLPGATVVLTRDFTNQELGILPLQPRCHRHELHLPSYAVLGGTAQVEILLDDRKEDGAGVTIPLACADETIGPRGLISTNVPYGYAGRLKSVSVTSGGMDARTLTRFAATWTDEKPPPILQLGVSAVSFSWRRDPLYPPNLAGPDKDCPGRVELPAAGVTCHEVTSRVGPMAGPLAELCHYVCGGVSANERTPLFDLPTPVAFAYRDEARSHGWSDILLTVNQNLTSFVAPQDRYLAVHFEEWPQNIGNVAQSVVVTSLGRPTSLLVDLRSKLVPCKDALGKDAMCKAPRKPTILPLQGVTTGDVLTIAPQGDRAFAVQPVTVTDYDVHPPPLALTSPITLSAFGGGGFGVPFAMSSPGNATSAPPAWPQGTVDVAIVYRQINWQWTLESHASFTLASHAYFPEANPGTVRSPGAIPYDRWAFQTASEWRPRSSVALGPEGGFVLSYPTMSGDVRLAGGGPDVSAFLGGMLRYQLTTAAWIEADLGWLLPEHYHQYVTSGGPSALQGGPQVVKDWSVAFSANVGLRFEVPLLVW